ncbi:MAG: T9SS type A sorting domain-containing protein [Bacteroidota bacterium]
MLKAFITKIFVPAAIMFATTSAALAQNRVVLIEQFSNSSCAPCGAISPSVYAFVNNNQPDVAAIAYHTQFPYNNDSMYFENPVEATQRVNFYSVQGVPHSVLDGNVFNGSTNTFFPNISSMVANRLSVVPRYQIQATSLMLNGSQLTGSFKFISTGAMNAGDNLVAQVVIVEKNVLKSSYAASPGANNETEYGYVMRKMIPNAAGTNLVNKTINGSDSIALNWTLTNIKNKSELRVVAFVQNTSTKEVYQAQLFNVPPGPVGISENGVNTSALQVYPNPSSGGFAVCFKNEQFIKSISIFSQLGELVFSEAVNTTTSHITRQIDLSTGVYLIEFETSSGRQASKLIIAK